MNLKDELKRRIELKRQAQAMIEKQIEEMTKLLELLEKENG